MNLKQIEERLNKEFSGEGRRLVFWFDGEGEFVSDMDSLALENAKVYKLAENDQFYTKYFLECVDVTTNYLVYAPFAKPDDQHNYLADLVHYSKEFHANRAALLCADLGVGPELRPLFLKYRKFFDSTERENKFVQLKLDKFDEDSFLTALMSVVCKCKASSFEDVLRIVLINGIEPGDNAVLAEFDKFDLTVEFWRLCSKNYGYVATGEPSLSKFVLALFVTYTAQTTTCEPPKAWAAYISGKRGNVVNFMDGMMNNVVYRDAWMHLSRLAEIELAAPKYFAQMDLGDILACDSFVFIDEMLVNWLVERLLAEDTDAKLNGKGFDEIIALRRLCHFGDVWNIRFDLLACAFDIVKAANYQPKSDIEAIIENYKNSDWRLDMDYRHFYVCFDRLTAAERAPFERLRQFVENIYTNEYLEKLSLAWTAALEVAHGITPLVPQREFYKQFISNNGDRLIVIISDAFRYEVACELLEKLMADEKCEASINMVAGVVPSFTKLGMAALLPHESLKITDDAVKVSVDDRPCDSTEQRDAILKSVVADSACVQFDEAFNAKRADVRSIFANKKVVYVYHNQIDARGDKPASENEVFTACGEAIKEIYDFIRKLTESVSARNFIVTADHGFVYRRDKLQEYDKVDGLSGECSCLAKRFAIAGQQLQVDGARCLDLKSFIGGEDPRCVLVPSGAGIFKAPGAGQNYVHGGAAPQEIFVPVLKVHTLEGHKETRPASIDLISTVQKITSLNQTLDFIQKDAVSDVVKEAKYKFFFVSDSREQISNEQIYIAASKDEDAAKRLFHLKFTFKNKKYGGEKYFLEVYNMGSAIDELVIKREVTMDIAFADDFGF